MQDNKAWWENQNVTRGEKEATVFNNMERDGLSKFLALSQDFLGQGKALWGLNRVVLAEGLASYKVSACKRAEYSRGAAHMSIALPISSSYWSSPEKSHWSMKHCMKTYSNHKQKMTDLEENIVSLHLSFQSQYIFTQQWNMVVIYSLSLPYKYDLFKLTYSNSTARKLIVS